MHKELPRDNTVSKAGGGSTQLLQSCGKGEILERSWRKAMKHSHILKEWLKDGKISRRWTFLKGRWWWEPALGSSPSFFHPQSPFITIWRMKKTQLATLTCLQLLWSLAERKCGAHPSLQKAQQAVRCSLRTAERATAPSTGGWNNQTLTG